MADLPAPPREPPAALKAQSDVDGWTVPVNPGSNAQVQRMAMVSAAVALFGLVTFATISLSAAMSAGMLVGIGVVGVLLLAGGVVLINRQGTPPALQITPTHLILHRGGERERIPWSRVGPPRILEDARDDWTQAFHASMQTQEAHAPLKPEEPPGAVVVRWTTDGRPAEFASERTEWDHLVLARGLPDAALSWLQAAIEHARATEAEARRNAAFDEAVSGGEGARAQAALEGLLKDRDR